MFYTSPQGQSMLPVGCAPCMQSFPCRKNMWIKFLILLKLVFQFFTKPLSPLFFRLLFQLLFRLYPNFFQAFPQLFPKLFGLLTIWILNTAQNYIDRIMHLTYHSIAQHLIIGWRGKPPVLYDLVCGRTVGCGYRKKHACKEDSTVDWRHKLVALVKILHSPDQSRPRQLHNVWLQNVWLLLLILPLWGAKGDGKLPLLHVTSCLNKLDKLILEGRL